MIRARWLALAAGIALGAGCGSDTPPRSIAELQDPQTCNECHPKHYQQWSGSMHAYASDDPVFVAMNRRGQRDTGGALGAFCVQCHAPMAVKLGLTGGADFDPAQLPASARGVTCYVCHNVASVAASHNNGLVLADDQTMRGGIADPVGSSAHRSRYDQQMDSDVNQSEICGSCHDVVTPRGVALERTYQEWQTTFFAQPDPLHHLSCGSCHMRSSTDVVADAPGLNVPLRRNGFHEHMWPAIDQALTEFPETAAQAAAIQRDLDPAIAVIGPAPLGSNHQPGGVCVDQTGQLTVRIDSIGTAHGWPSGAAQDRRAWLEVVAYNASGAVLFKTGVLQDGQPLPDGMDPEQLDDPNLLGLWDRTFKDDGSPAHFFWDVARVESNLLRPPVTLDKNSPLFDHSTTARFDLAAFAGQIDRITARIRIRPLSYAMLADLVASGDLAPEIPGRMRTLDIVGTQSTWTAATRLNSGCNPE